MRAEEPVTRAVGLGGDKQDYPASRRDEMKKGMYEDPSNCTKIPRNPSDGEGNLLVVRLREIRQAASMRRFAQRVGDHPFEI
jgi:hypothetical protein